MIIHTEDLDLFDQGVSAKVLLIEYLAYTKRWVTVAEFVQEIDLTKRTVEKYLHLVQEDIENFHQEEKIELLYDKKLGYFLQTNSLVYVEDFLLYQLQNTLSYRLMYGIFFETISSAIQFAHDNYTSESTVWRLTKEFRKKIQHYQLDIKKGSFQLVGEEGQVRQLLYSIMWLLFKGKTWPFPQVSQARVASIIEEIESVFGLKLSSFRRQNLAYYIAICIVRNQKGHTIQQKAVVFENTNNNPLFDLYEERIKNYFFEETWSKAESAFLFSVLLTRDECYRNEKVREQIYDFHERNQTDLYQSILFFEHELKAKANQLKFPQNNTHLLRDYIFSSHAFCQLFHGFRFSMNGYNYWDREQLKYPNLVRQLEEIINDLYIKTKNHLFLQRRFLIIRYLVMYASITELPQLEEKMTILLVTDLPIFEEKRLMLLLKKNYQNDYNMEIVTPDTVDNNNYQLIVSTSKVPQTSEKTVPNVIFDTELTKMDYAELDSLLWVLIKNR